MTQTGLILLPSSLWSMRPLIEPHWVTLSLPSWEACTRACVCVLFQVYACMRSAPRARPPACARTHTLHIHTHTHIPARWRYARCVGWCRRWGRNPTRLRSGAVSGSRVRDFTHTYAHARALSLSYSADVTFLFCFALNNSIEFYVCMFGCFNSNIWVPSDVRDL